MMIVLLGGHVVLTVGRMLCRNGDEPCRKRRGRRWHVDYWSRADNGRTARLRLVLAADDLRAARLFLIS